MNASATTTNQFSYLNLRASEKGVSELSSKGARVVFIPSNQIENVEVRFGSRAERPILQLIMAVCLLAFGAVGIYLALECGARGLYWGSGFIAFGIFGVYSLYEALKKAHYLAVVCKNGTRKLIPRGSVSEVEFSKFASDASIRFRRN
jgi:hypothetical protein